MKRDAEPGTPTVGETDAAGSTTGEGGPPGIPVTLAAGDRVARFEILSQLGAGGMGVVYAARDPQLDRKLAIKLVHAEVDWHKAAGRKARLLREAQALARLSHPNVTHVYEVGTFGDQVFIAMELVDGSNLAEWLAAERRPWSAVLEPFLHAGRGLAAAHRAGFVHRDVKPENILVGRDGRVRITDFGIVGRGTTSESQDDDGEGASPEWTTDSLTRSGARLGTPAYMAPEQHTGELADARADQFSFAVALYEAVYGERPFGGATAPALRREVLAGVVRPAPRGTSVPSWLRAALLRGLALDPADRWPSMDAFLDALAPRRVSPLLWLLPGSAALIGGAVVIALLLGGKRSSSAGSQICAGAERRLVGVWDPQVKARVRRAFVSAEHAWTADAFDRLSRVLDDYATAWVGTHTEACEASSVRRERSPARMDLQMLCLDRRLTGLTSLVEVLGRGDPEVAERAIPLALRLEPISGCADADLLARAVPPPPAELRGAVASLRARIATANTLALAGKGKEAIAAARIAVTEARQSPYPPVLGEALFVLGKAESEGTDLVATEAAYQEAARIAAGARDDTTLAMTLSELVWTLGVRLPRRADALALRIPAELAIERAGGDALSRGRLLHSIGTVLAKDGRYDEAVVALEEAAALKEKALGPDHPELAGTLTQLATRYLQRDEVARARPLLERAVAITTRAFGPDHPRVGLALNQLGNAYWQGKQFAQAEVTYRRTLKLLAAAYGNDDPRTIAARMNVANVLDDLGHTEEAIVLHREVLAARERALGPESEEVAQSLLNLGLLLAKLKRFDESVPLLRRGLAIDEKTFGPEHPEVATALASLGQVLADSGHPGEAIPLLQRSLRVREKALGPRHPGVGEILLILADALEAARRHAESLAIAQRALAFYADGKDPESLARAQRAATIARGR